jgi:hypothetical protein
MFRFEISMVKYLTHTLQYIFPHFKFVQCQKHSIEKQPFDSLEHLSVMYKRPNFLVKSDVREI